MTNNLEKLAYDWIIGDSKEVDKNSEYYCSTRDTLKARTDSMINQLLKTNIDENDIYTLSAVAGEIGNNSYDHNIGNWPDIMGIFFAYSIINDKITIALADRGQGVLKTLKKVKPDLKNDTEALRVAFYEKISGRAPEKRGNGLKFVRHAVENAKIHLSFISGTAQIEINNEVITKQLDNNIRGCLAIITF